MLKIFRNSLLSLVLVLASALSPQTAAAQTFINSVAASGTTLSITIPAGGQVIVVAADGGRLGLYAVADRQPRQYLPPAGHPKRYLLGQTWTLFDCTSPGATGTATLTLSGATGGLPGLAVYTYTSLGAFQTGTAVSKSAHTGWSTGTNGATSPSTTPTSQPAMIFSVAIGSSIITAGTAFNSRLNLANWKKAIRLSVRMKRSPRPRR